MTEHRRDDRVTDAAVDTAWRQAASEQPPAEVDAAILAAARAAVRRDAKERPPARPPRRWSNWQPLAAAAGVIGLSFLLVQMLPRDRLTQPPAKQDASRAPVAESAPDTVAPEPSAAPAPAAAPPSVPPPAAPAASATSDAAIILSEERAATAGVAPRAAMEAAAKQSVEARPESPAAWASRITALHDAGDVAAAEKELRAFRTAYPDADDYLPEPLQAWANSVGRDGIP
jgi:hypothetical protein